MLELNLALRAATGPTGAGGDRRDGDPERPGPETTTGNAIRRARRGRFRVYLGAAPGVGKTVEMLSEGRRRAARGTDVVVGVWRSTVGSSPPSRSGSCPSCRGGSCATAACS